MMRFSFLLVLLLSVTVTVSAVTDTRSCIQGGAPPAECPDNFHWDSVACRWVCNQPSVPVECVANPCDAAVQSGACSREACIPDYSKGCNFICATPTPPTGVNCIINPCDAAVKSGACSRESCVPDYSKGCNFICNTPAPTSSGVNCIIDPCQNADREGICPKQFCTADYSRGCDFKCSKCTLTCATVKCAGGEQCTIDQQCQPHCQPIPTTPTCSPVCKASCIEGYECGHDENGCAKCVPSPTPTPTPTPVVDPTPSTCHRDVCLQACIPGYSCQTDSNGCKKCLPTPTSPPTGVKCFIDPCQNAARNGVCPKESCTADYSHGCNFKCSKCTLTCATVKCAGGTECVQDDECKVQCRPAPTATPTSSGPDVCIQGGAPPAECSGPGQYEWDNKACKWICKPTVPVECVANPCDAAVKSGACSREACIPDYSKGCNFICNTPTPPTGVKCIIDPCQNADREGKCPFKYCTADYSKGCDFKCSIPTPTPTPTGVNCIINPCENAAREGKCPKEYCTPDYSRGCDFKCSIPTPDPSCPRTCIFNCAIGMACHPDQFGCIRCMKTCTTNQGNTVYQGDQYYQGCASCTCGGVCSHLACQGKCFDDQGKSHNEKDVVPQPDGCNTCSCTGGQWKCTQKNCAPPGSAVVLSASFTLTTAFRTNSRVFTLLHHEASEADVRASFAINKDDITFDSITTNGMYKFNVKCSFKGANDADREASWNAFKRQLRIDGISTSGVTIAAAANGVGSGGTGFIAEDLDTATTTTETMMMQSCENGQDIPAEQQCQDQAMNVPVSGSTSSTPIAIIIGPIVGGIVLLALIATAAIVIARRRTNTVKTMHSAAYDNNMTPNPAVTATDGEQRV